MKAGSYGGKLLGAGGGGVLCFIVPPDRQNDVKKALQSLIHIPIKFSYAGSEIIIRNGD
jgi:D-glycero-alpha-D-manno-heptose-7-phosphate kinase